MILGLSQTPKVDSKDKQPFTRSLSGASIPESIREVTVRAHDSVQGYGGNTVKVAIPRK